MSAKPEPRNLLGDASSPYLVQHANNPVHWRPWGQQALEEARSSGKPILLSVGYAACHWCHVMAHESFEDESIAALMNTMFVNIKVDREERPDIDQIYMSALHAMGEQGGWPMTMFLDPDGNPFWGGTYFPPTRKYGRPSFPDVLNAINHAWNNDRDSLTSAALTLRAHLQEPQANDGAKLPDSAEFDRVAEALLGLHDPVNGGIRGNPKFPNAPFTELWLRAANGKADNPFGTAFLKSIRTMSLGGIYDHLRGGLSRYSVDGRWLVPHFEKMLYDNAHYLRALKWAWQLQPDPLFRQRIDETIDWASDEMMLADGAFSSSIDADSEGEEGRFYVWSQTEIEAILGPDAQLFNRLYDVSAGGNFEGHNILNRLKDLPVNPQTETILAAARAKLLDARAHRARPGLDDKILTDWNGYFIRALSECAFTFDNPVWMKLAKTAFHCIAESMDERGRLPHSRRGKAQIRPAIATDYAAMINAALSISEATGQNRYCEHAAAWMQILDLEYSDGHGGYFLTSNEADALITRPGCHQDEANPSAASQILEALVRLASATGDNAYLEKAWRLASNLRASLGNARQGAAGYWNAVHTLQNNRHVTLSAENRAGAESFLAVLRHTADPALTFAIDTTNQGHVFMGTVLSGPKDKPTAIVCTHQACSQPVQAATELAHLLQRVVNQP